MKAIIASILLASFAGTALANTPKRIAPTPPKKAQVDEVSALEDRRI